MSEAWIWGRFWVRTSAMGEPLTYVRCGATDDALRYRRACSE